MKSLVQILKVNEPRSGTKNGYNWTMQDAECMLLNDDGSVSQVGVLMLPKALTGDAAPKEGQYSATFAMGVENKTRKMVANLTGLTPLPPNFFKVPAPVSGGQVNKA